MALSKITAASITDNSITNTQINSSAAIAKTKLASLDVVNADINANAGIVNTKFAAKETVLQVVNNHNTAQNSYSGGSSASGLDVLDSGTITTKALNSQFYIQANISYAISTTSGTNWDSKDIHWACLRTYNTGSGANHAYVGFSGALTRNTGNAGSSASRWYATDVAWTHNEFDEQHQGNYDTHQLSFSFFDQPNQAAGTTVQYRIRGWYQAAMYINRSITQPESGGICNLTIMELGAN